MTEMANNFYYCGKLAVKLLIFRFIITYLGKTQNAPYCTILIPKKKNADP